MKNVLVFILVSFCINLFSQQADSLENRLNEVKGLEKLEVLHALVEKYINNDASKSKDYIDQIHTISKELNDPEELFNGLNVEGYYWYLRGDFKKTLEVYEKADSIALALSDREKHADVLYAKGRSVYFLGDYVSCNQYFIEAAKIQDSLGNKRKLVNAYNGLALVHMDQNEYEQAMSYINKAEEEGSKLAGFDLEAILSTKGIIYKELGDFEKSIEYHNKTLALSEKNNNTHGIAKDYNNLAASYSGLKNFKKAKEYYEKALLLKKELNDASGEAVTMVGFAMILVEENNINEAILMLKESLNIAKNIGNKDLTKYIYENLTDAYNRTGNFEKAFQSQGMYMAVKDSIHNIEFQKKIAELNVAYQTEKKELEIKQQQEEIIKNKLVIKNNRLYGILAFMGFILLSTIVIAYLKRMQHKREKLQEIIAHRKELNRITTQSKLQEQRIRISRDLHDNIGSQLTFIISSIENLKYISKEVDSKFHSKLGQIIRFSKDTITQLRNTIWAINQNEISLDNFQSRILSFIEKAKSSNDEISIHFENSIEENIAFSSIKGVNVFRVLQEAVNNSIKYSNASNIYIDLSVLNDKLRISIHDDGDGFDITEVIMGNGIENMQRRIEEVGGTFNIESESNKGTIITILCSKNTLNVV